MSEKHLRVALVHDYLSEYGGAEKVLEELSNIFPEAPIYTAFCVSGSTAAAALAGRKIITSWFQKIPWRHKLHSPLRFLTPWIWGSFDFSNFDLVITSASWYVTKGVRKSEKGVEICYCHTPPRWLYGYDTSIDMRKWWLVRVYANIVGHFLRIYDFEAAQRVSVFVANSKNVANRIRKFYKKEAVVIYPPVDVVESQVDRGDYYLIVSRIVGGKGIDLAIEAATKKGFKLVIAGERAGLYDFAGKEKIPSNVQFVGRVSEEEKGKLMAGARGFLALARDEDFGITPVEAQAQGTPVVAFRGGGYKESVVENKTGVFFDDWSAVGIIEAVDRFEKIKWSREAIKKNAKKFSGDRFEKEIRELVEKTIAA